MVRFILILTILKIGLLHLYYTNMFEFIMGTSRTCIATIVVKFMFELLPIIKQSIYQIIIAKPFQLDVNFLDWSNMQLMQIMQKNPEQRKL